MEPRPTHHAARLTSLVTFLFLLLTVSAAEPRRSGFVMPFYEDGTKLQAIFGGDGAVNEGDGRVRVTNFVARTFQEGDRNRLELTVEAPMAVFSQETREASSSGPIRFFTANSNYVLTGEGFLWRQREGLLFVSNNVVTTIVEGRDGAARPVEIRARRLRFDEPKREALYSDEVRATAPDFGLTSGELAVSLTPSNELRRLAARQDVRFTDPIHGAAATANQADYEVLETGERIELTGDASWRDAFRESRARRYVIELRPDGRTVLADGDAWFRLPRAALSQPGGFLAEPTAAKTRTTTTNFVEITAARIRATLPPETNLVRHILAETNVVIVSTDGGRATADWAEYDEASGNLVLTGAESRQPEWRLGETLLRGDRLTVNRRTEDTEARGRAFLRARLPVNDADGLPRADVSTNLFVEADADWFRGAGGRVTFGERTRVRVLEDDALAATLDCATLIANFGAARELLDLVAAGDVRGQQFPVNGRTNFLAKEFTAGRLEAKFRPEDRTLLSLEAFDNARAEQRVALTNGATQLTTAAARSAVAWFNSGNQVDRFVARQDVRLSRDADRVEGRQAVYQGTNGLGLMELTGEPVAVKDGTTMRGATALIWDQANDKIRALGPFYLTNEVKAVEQK